MTTPESETKKAVKELLKEFQILPFKEALADLKNGKLIHGYYQMPSSTGYGEAGIADFLLCIQGHYVEVETKGNGKQSAIQKLHQEVVEGAGASYFLVKTSEDIALLRGRLNNSFNYWKEETAFDYETSQRLQ